MSTAAQAATAAHPQAPAQHRDNVVRDQLAYMFCGLWMITGLYIDGWAHEADRPETFFSPWHGVLYSGFAAAMLYTAYTARRDKGGVADTPLGSDRLTTVGAALFVLGGASDMVWHEIAGIEADLEALVSPTHLLLMIGGLFMVTLPIRAALRANSSGTEAITRGARVAIAASATLALGLTLFFLMYLSPWNDPDNFLVKYLPDAAGSDFPVQVGVASLLLTTILFCGALLWPSARWTLPTGTATVMFTAVALAQSGLEGFDLRLPVLAATAAGVTADLLLRARRPLPVVGAATGAVLSSSFFALLHIEQTVRWSPDLWVGAIFFAALVGYGTGLAVALKQPAR